MATLGHHLQHVRESVPAERQNDSHIGEEI